MLGHILESGAIGFRQYEVINAGVPGWSSDQIALRVRYQIAALKPDVAILYVGWNDFQAYDPLRPVPSESSFVLWYGRTPWMEYADSTSRTVALLSALRQRRSAGPGAERRRDAAAPADRPDERYRFLLRSLTDIVHDLKSTNPSMTILVGTLVGIWPQTTYQGKLVVPGWVAEHHLTPAQAAHFVDELNDQLRRFAGEQGAAIVDLAAIFGPLDKGRLHWDFAHLKKDGYEMMAWAIFDALRAEGLFKVQPSGRYQELLSAYQAPPSAAGAVDGR